MRILVTGGAGFIGSAFVRQAITEASNEIVTVDKLNYAGNRQSLAAAYGHERHAFEQVDVCDESELDRIFEHYRPDAVLHLAAESHVDRSIDDPTPFVRTNIVGCVSHSDCADSRSPGSRR